MGNDASNTGQLLKDGAAGAVVGGMIGGPVGAVIGGVGGVAVGGLVSMFSGGPTAQQQSANVGGQSIDAVAIYKKISTGNTGSIDGGIGAAKDLETVHSDRVGKIDSLNGAMDGAWQGNSAAAAQAGGHALSIWHDDSATNLQKSHTFLTNQKDSFHTVQGQVHQLPDSPPKMGFWDHAPWSDKDDEINKYNDNSKANVQAYTAYYTSSAQNAGGMPTFNTWKGNNISDGTGDPNNIPGGGGGGHIGSGGGGGGGSFNPNTKVPTFNSNVPSTPHSNLPNVPTHDPNSTNLPNVPNDHTSASSYVPPSVDPSTFNPSGFGPGGGGGAGGGFGPGGGGAGGGSAAFGPGAFGGGFGPGGASSGAAAGGAGEGAGGMRGGAMGGGAAGKAGSSGMGGMGGGGRGGGKKGEEDQEHQTKYLVEEDNNELFGSDQLTVPPVIGE